MRMSVSGMISSATSSAGGSGPGLCFFIILPLK